jgi:hypothetical protein
MLRCPLHVARINLGGDFNSKIDSAVIGHMPATHDCIQAADLLDLCLGQRAAGLRLAQQIIQFAVGQNLWLAQDATEVDEGAFAILALQ